MTASDFEASRATIYAALSQLRDGASVRATPAEFEQLKIAWVDSLSRSAGVEDATLNETGDAISITFSSGLRSLIAFQEKGTLGGGGEALATTPLPTRLFASAVGSSAPVKVGTFDAGSIQPFFFGGGGGQLPSTAVPLNAGIKELVTNNRSPIIRWRFEKTGDAATLQAFRGLDSGIVHIRTHGNTFWTGKLKIPSPNAAADGAEVGSRFHFPILWTGQEARSGDEIDWERESTPCDGCMPNLVQELIAYVERQSDGTIKATLDRRALYGVTPYFFAEHGSSMPNSIVLLEACFGLESFHLANALLRKGATAVVGFTGYVFTEYAEAVGNQFIKNLLVSPGMTATAAFNDAVAKAGVTQGDFAKKHGLSELAKFPKTQPLLAIRPANDVTVPRLAIAPTRTELAPGDVVELSADGAQSYAWHLLTALGGSLVERTDNSIGFRAGLTPGVTEWVEVVDGWSNRATAAIDVRQTGNGTYIEFLQVDKPGDLYLPVSVIENWGYTGGTAIPLGNVIGVIRQPPGIGSTCTPSPINSLLISPDQPWIHVSAKAITGCYAGTDGGINIQFYAGFTAETSGLPVGPHYGRVGFDWPGSNNHPQLLAIASLFAPEPVLAVTPTHLEFSGTVGAQDPQPQSISIGNSGTGTLAAPTVSVSYGSGGSNWLVTSRTGSGNSYAVSVQPRLGGLAAGTYSAGLSIASSNATNSPRTITVTFTVSPPGGGGGGGTSCGYGTSTVVYSGARSGTFPDNYLSGYSAQANLYNFAGNSVGFMLSGRPAVGTYAAGELGVYVLMVDLGAAGIWIAQPGFGSFSVQLTSVTLCPDGSSYAVHGTISATAVPMTDPLSGKNTLSVTATF